MSREAGARHLVQGTVHKAADRVRVTAQLVDAESGSHLWAERYDRTVEHVFDVQDELVEKIVTVLRSSLAAPVPTPEP